MKFIKLFIFLNFLLFTSCFLTSCKKEVKQASIYEEEYELYDDNGTIKCKNFDFVACVEKEKGKDFKILNFADVQLYAYQVENEVGSDTLTIIKNLIEEVEPDLITLTGDQGYGEPVSINAIGRVINSFGIPWAYVFGNHDQECVALSLKEQIKLSSKFSNCITKYGPEEITDSVTDIPRGGNYIINIVEKDNDNINVIRSIFMMNSGTYVKNTLVPEDMINTTSYEHLTDKQLDFYKWGLESSKKYNNGEYVKSTIVEHIPITAYAFAFAAAYNSTYSAYLFDRLSNISKNTSLEDSYNGSCWKDGYKDSFGVCHETVCCSPAEDGIFNVLLEYGSTDSMLVGHDHRNNFSINYQGIRLSYGMKTGYGSYFEETMNGGTVLTVTDSSVRVEHIYNK